MLVGVHPLIAYAIVGLGAAAYSPAKYGILTELLPPSQLVKANGWIEGLTIASIILGAVFGGQLIGDKASRGACWPSTSRSSTPASTPPPEAGHRLHGGPVLHRRRSFNLEHPPHRGVRCSRSAHGWRPTWCATSPACNSRLWQRQAGRRSRWRRRPCSGACRGTCATSSSPGPRRALAYGTTQASALVGVVAIGTAVGAVVASMRMRLDKATSVIPLGIGMGLLMLVPELHQQPLAGHALPDPAGRGSAATWSCR